MTKVKIKSINIKGLRGVKNEITLKVNNKSALFYGDNGSGKSGLSDAIEWYLYDKINHLTNEEIGRKGNEALRNIFLDEKDKAFIALEFNDSKINNTKTIEDHNGNIKTSFINKSSDSDQYLESVKNENIILRYKDLIKFVLSSKTDKLKNLSDTISLN